MMKLFTVIIIIFSFSTFADCEQWLEKQSSYKDNFYVKVKTKQDIALKDVYKCLVPNYPSEKLTKKTRTIKAGTLLHLPVSKTKRWGANLRYGLGSFESNSSRTTDITSTYIEGSYQFLLKKFVIAKAEFGFKYMTADLDDSEGRKVYDSAVVGNFKITYEKHFRFQPYVFYNLDRYVVTDVNNNDLDYSFQYINSLGTGTRYSFKNNFFGTVDAAIILPTTNSINAINSGFKTGLGVEYKWKQLSASYRYEYFQIDTKIYNDIGTQHFVNIGVSF